MRRSERVGSLIGAVGGLLFVLVNAGGLTGGVAWAARVLGVAAFVAVVILVVLRRGGTVAEDPPSRRQIRTYGISVTVMVLAIIAGARVLDASGRAELVVVWVVLCVGAHFLPFARAFAVPVFARLGLVLIGLAVVGGVVALTTASAVAPAATAVLAGLALLAAALSPGLRRR